MAGDDAVVARARGRAGDDPPAAQGRAASGSPRDLIVETGRIVARDLTRALRHRAAAARGRRPQPACRRGRHARQRGRRDRRARGRAAARRRHRRARAAAGRHDVPRGRARDLRRGALHVSRPGADPDQDAGLRPRASTSRSACRSCAPRPITAPPSTSPAPARANPTSLIAALQACGAACRARTSAAPLPRARA